MNNPQNSLTAEMSTSCNDMNFQTSQKDGPNRSSSSKNIIAVIGVLLGFLLFSVGGYFLGINNKNKTDTTDNTRLAISQEDPLQFGCKKIIEVIRENDTYYAACDDKAFVIKNDETVTVWEQSDLQVSEITSMAKLGNHLYFGSDGVTSLDLYSGEIYKYTAQENDLQLNVGDTKVASDGLYVWVITFGDVYQIDTSSSNIKVLTNEVSGGKLGFEDVFISPSSVYIRSQESVFRFYKESQRWEKFDSSTFGSPLSPESQLIFSNGMVVLLQPRGTLEGGQQNRFWYAIDDSELDWKAENNIMTRIEKDYPFKQGYEPGVLIKGLEEDSVSIIFSVNQYNDTTYYYSNLLTGEVGLARNKFGDSFVFIDPSDEYGEYLNRVISNYYLKNSN